MEIALILVVVTALVAFFLLRGKKSAASDQLTESPDAERRPARSASPTTQAETPHARRKSEAPPAGQPHSPEALPSGSAGHGEAALEEEEPGEEPRSGIDGVRPAPSEAAPAETSDATRDSSAELLPESDDAEDASYFPVDPESVDTQNLGSEAPPPLVRSPAPPDAAKTLGLLSLRKGLKRSRESEGFFGRLKALLGGRQGLDPSLAEEIEEVLLTSDVGVKTTEKILQRLRDGMSRGDLSDEAKVFKALREEAHKTLAVEGTAGALVLSARPTVVLLVGVNGAGKTTTIGKLAQKLTAEGKKVMLSAGDTFRAAAVEQLKAWGERSGCDVITGKEGADPSSVLFDAIGAAKAAGADVLLADTAGRLHTKTNLMQEMTKIQKVAGKALEGAPHETLLVIDSTNGQNALAQAREFKETLPLTGLVLTKLDGTAKGGVVLGICDDLKVPVRYVGVGERAEDLHAFEPAAFVEALLGAENEVIAA